MAQQTFRFIDEFGCESWRKAKKILALRDADAGEFRMVPFGRSGRNYLVFCMRRYESPYTAPLSVPINSRPNIQDRIIPTPAAVIAAEDSLTTLQDGFLRYPHPNQGSMGLKYPGIEAFGHVQA